MGVKVKPLIVKNLYKKFGRTIAVYNASFSVDKGCFLLLAGPNGAGKTTMLRMLACLIPPSYGQIIINGVNAIKNPDLARKFIGYLPERTGLYDKFSVRRQLEFHAKLVGKQNVKEAVEEVAEFLGLKEHIDKLCGALSRGLRQRVVIAQLLLRDPQILLLDEPTNGLDPVSYTHLTLPTTERV